MAFHSSPNFLHTTFVSTLLPLIAESWKLLCSFLSRALKDNESPTWPLLPLLFFPACSQANLYLSDLINMSRLILTGNLSRDSQVTKSQSHEIWGVMGLQTLSVFGKFTESLLINRADRHMDKPQALRTDHSGVCDGNMCLTNLFVFLGWPGKHANLKQF